MDYVNYSIRDTMWNTHQHSKVSSPTRWSYHDTLTRNYVHKQDSDEHREMIRNISIFLKKNSCESIAKDIEEFENTKWLQHYDIYALAENMVKMGNFIKELLILYDQQWIKCNEQYELGARHYDPVLKNLHDEMNIVEF